MRHLLPLLFLLSSLVVFLPGCEPKEELLQTSGSLELAADTVLFDTVFTTVGTVTKRLWVYNRNRGAVKTDISLEGLAGGTYTLLINGDPGPSASGVTIRGNDSLQVLVRATLGDNGTAPPRPFLVEDRLHFRTNGTDQVARLVAYGQNAYFHRGDLIGTGNTVEWATDKPHVIFNRDVPNGAGGTVPVGVAVLEGTTLRIPRGARVYFHAGASLQVSGTLLVNDNFAPTGMVKDSSRDVVRFQGDRLEPFYNDIPGQWAGIIFTETSRGNMVRYAEIKNSTFGLLLYNPNDNMNRPDVTVENSTFKNISGSNISFANASASTGGGIISYSGQIVARNCLFTNCGEYAVLGLGGGRFNFNYCTFANYTPSFRRETASLTFSNKKATGPNALANVTLTNSIVWGSVKDEIFFEGDINGYTPIIRNNLIRTEQYVTEQQFNSSSYGNLLNVNPLFKRTYLNAPNRYDYHLEPTSPALNRAPTFPNTALLFDLWNLPRPQPAGTQPDLGAYEQ